MKTIILALLVIICVTGCASKPCYRQVSVVNNYVEEPEVTNVQVACPPVAKPATPWYYYLFIPVAFIANLSELQRSAVTSSHYQAGGSAALR